MSIMPKILLTETFLNRGTSSHSRPRTPPKPSATNAPSYLAHRSGNVASPPREPYAIMTSGVNEWSRDPTEDDEDEDDEIVYDDDEDEFGLPSLASMRRKKKPSSNKSKGISPGGAMNSNPGSLGFGLSTSNRQRANSSDIAEERGTPMYPTARKSEGKILRPQYKDILQGLNPFPPRD